MSEKKRSAPSAPPPTKTRSTDVSAFRIGTQILGHEPLSNLVAELAAELRQHDVAVGVPVGVAVVHPVDLTAAAMAVMECGATCVLLDPRENDPEITGVVLTTRTYAHRFTSDVATVVLIEIEMEDGICEDVAPTISPDMIVREGDDKPAVFVVPDVRTGDADLTPLSEQIPTGHPVYRLDTSPTDRAPVESIERLATWHLDRMRAIIGRTPCHLVGFGFGGALAYEIATQLRQLGGPVGLLAVVDTPLEVLEISRFDPVRYLRALRRLPAWIRHDLLTTPPAQIPHRLARLMDRAGHPLDLETVEASSLAAAAARRMLTTWRPQPLDIPFHVLRASAVPPLARFGSDLGWSVMAERDASLSVVPGRFGDLLGTRSVVATGQRLATLIERTDPSGSTSIDLQSMALHAA